MDFESVVQVLVLILFLFISAILSGFEYVLFSLRNKIPRDFKSGNFILSEYIREITDHPVRMKISITIFKSIALVIETIIYLILILKFVPTSFFSKELLIVCSIILLAFFIIVFVEILPNQIAKKYPDFILHVAGIPVAWVIMLIYPVIKIIKDIFYLFLSLFHFKTGNVSSKFDLNKKKSFEDNSEEDIKHDDKEIIASLESSKQKTVREVMTPRADIIAVSEDTGLDELIKLIIESAHSRIPVYKENLDNITGIIYSKDLLPQLKQDRTKDKINLLKVARKVMFVPETKPIGDLMNEFQEKKMHISIVVDEFGGTSGLISMDDILEEIVGEIKDEYDVEETEITGINNNTFVILGRTPIEKVCEEFNINLYSDEGLYDTIGGFVLNYAGFIPKEGYSFTFKNLKFTVKEIINRRINKILIEVLSEN